MIQNNEISDHFAAAVLSGVVLAVIILKQSLSSHRQQTMTNTNVKDGVAWRPA